jgi:aminoglycoside phosphotransferase (APT) family kinase protein
VIGVLDWELSTIGHPLSDLSNLLQPFYVPNVGQMVGLRDIKGPLPIPGAEELMKYYCQQRKISYPIPNWEFAIAFSFFRLAVIAQGIAARVARKQASSAQAKIYAEKFKPINALALEYMDKGDIQSKSRL